MDRRQRGDAAPLFALCGIREGERPAPLSHLRLPLMEALARWGRILRQEDFLLACLGGRAEVRLVRADYLECDRSNGEGQAWTLERITYREGAA